MTLHRSLFLGAISALALASSACNGEEECSYTRPDGVIELVEGTGAINDEHVVTAANSFVSCDRDRIYQWTFLRTPTESEITDGTFQGNNTGAGVQQTLTFDEPGTYVVQMTIFDGVQSSVEALYVFEIVSDNLPPEANAGPDRTTAIGELVELDGSESYDPELVDLEYRWTLESKPDGSQRESDDVYDADRELASFVGDVSGTYVFSLEVKDLFVWSAKDYVTVTVVGDNEPPIANASSEREPTSTLTACQSQDPISLNGSRSWDPERAELTYEWGLVSVPEGSSATVGDFTDITDPRPLFHHDVAGDYQFELRVHDGELWSAWDVTTVTTTDLALNRAPVADPGEDLEIEVEARCYNFSGSWRCGACPMPELVLNATASEDPDGDDLNFLWTVASGEGVTIEYPEGPLTSITPDAIPGEYGRTKSYSWTFDVRVGDCVQTDSASVTIDYTCVGVEE